MKLMLDVNIVLDVLERREPHYRYSSIVLSEVTNQKFEGMLPGHALTTIYYLIAKHRDRQVANEKIDWLLAHFKSVPADQGVFLRARQLPLKDFEDAVVASLAENFGCQWIVTRNVPDFEYAPVSAITPENFVNQYVFRAAASLN